MNQRNPKSQNRRRELIDTLWNVNEKEQVYEVLLKYELIDTLWNVNKPCHSRQTVDIMN